MARFEDGPHLEDFKVGEVIEHEEVAEFTRDEVLRVQAYNGPPRFRLQAVRGFAADIGYPAPPVDEFHAFNNVFGLTVPDISLKAISNLGYASGRFRQPVFVGDVLRAESEVIGVRQLESKPDRGIVWVRTTGINQFDDPAIEYVRHVMIPKRDPLATIDEHVPDLPEHVEPTHLEKAARHYADYRVWSRQLSNAESRWSDYQVGESYMGEQAKHFDASHMEMTKLHHNPAEVHFDERQVVYGGLILATMRAQSSEYLPDSLVMGINGGRHSAQVHPGDYVTSFHDVVDSDDTYESLGLGLLRIVSKAVKNMYPSDYFVALSKGEEPNLAAELDYWLGVPM